DSPEAATEVAKSLSSGGLLQHMKQGLGHTDPAVQRTAAEVVAKLAKCETCRCSDEIVSLVPSLMALHSASEGSGEASIATIIQATRALGNICYEHDAGRLAVLESGGAEAIVSLLQRAISWPDDCNRPPHKTEGQAGEDTTACSAVQELRIVVTGFLLNLTNSCDKITSVLCTPECISCLSRYLEQHCDEEDIPTHVLLALACMADS
ncbi:Armadillo-type fold, partial [Trinorchestia longiramus]